MKHNWFKFIVILTLFIFIGIGILIGIVIGDNPSCNENPLVFGIERLEEINEVNFSCSCISTDSPLDPFYFDDEGIYERNPLLN